MSNANNNNSNSRINASSSQFCFLDIDIDEHRSKLALAASFVHATDSRYGFSSKDLRKLGGTELARIEDTIFTDHEWSSKAKSNGVAVRPVKAGNRIVLRLFWDTSPLACENFATLCENGNNGVGKKVPIGACGKGLTYRGSIIHRVIPGFIMQAGDFVFGNGSGGESIFNNGKKFKDEKAGLELKHDKRGILSMGNSGKNSNTSQFFITLQPAPQCNSKHVVFGEVISGFEVLTAIETAAENNNCSDGAIVNDKKFTISDCGIFQPFVTPAAGYWYNQPDVDSYLGFTPVFMVRPRVIVLGPTKAVCQKFESVLRSTAIITTITMDDHDDDVDLVTEKINTLLHQLSIDVVLVAPACSKLTSLKTSLSTLPPSWEHLTAKYNISMDQIVIVSKPIEAFHKIKEKSWIGKHDNSWKLDGYQ